MPPAVDLRPIFEPWHCWLTAAKGGGLTVDLLAVGLGATQQRLRGERRMGVKWHAGALDCLGQKIVERRQNLPAGSVVAVGKLLGFGQVTDRTVARGDNGCDQPERDSAGCRPVSAGWPGRQTASFPILSGRGTKIGQQGRQTRHSRLPSRPTWPARVGRTKTAAGQSG